MYPAHPFRFAQRMPNHRSCQFPRLRHHLGRFWSLFWLSALKWSTNDLEEMEIDTYCLEAVHAVSAYHAGYPIRYVYVAKELEATYELRDTSLVRDQ